MTTDQKLAKGRSGADKSAKPKRRSSTQLTTVDWVNEASNVLASAGIDAVRVEPIANRLGVTKGSFYHHFADRPALHRAILTHWRQRATAQIIKRLNDGRSAPRERLQNLFHLPSLGDKSRRGANIELAIRLWAQKSDDAAQAVAEVDQQRLDYITTLLEHIGLESERARPRAFLFYAALMGQAVFDAHITEAEFDAVVERLLRD